MGQAVLHVLWTWPCLLTLALAWPCLLALALALPSVLALALACPDALVCEHQSLDVEDCKGEVARHALQH